MKKIIPLGLCVIMATSVLLSWNSNSSTNDELVKKISRAQTFQKLVSSRLKMIKEFELANYETALKHIPSQSEFDKITNNSKMSKSEKQEAYKKLGLVISPAYETSRLEGDRLLFQVKKEFPELGKLTTKKFKEVYSKAFLMTKETIKYEN